MRISLSPLCLHFAWRVEPLESGIGQSDKHADSTAISAAAAADNSLHDLLLYHRSDGEDEENCSE
jgi:hypothetical protein